MKQQIEKLKKLFGEVIIEDNVQISDYLVVNNATKFIDYNIAVAESGMGCANHYYYRARDYYHAIMDNYKMLYQKMYPSAEETESLINALYLNHKLGLALDEEYTPQVYDYLVYSKKLILTSEEKKTIFANCIAEYIKSLQKYVLSDNQMLAKDATREIDELKQGIVTPMQKERLAELSKVVAIKSYFDNCEEKKIYYRV